MRTEEYEEWLIPTYEEYEDEQTNEESKTLAEEHGVLDNWADHCASLKEDYYGCYDFVEWLIKNNKIKIIK